MGSTSYATAIVSSAVAVIISYCKLHQIHYNLSFIIQLLRASGLQPIDFYKTNPQIDNYKQHLRTEYKNYNDNLNRVDAPFLDAYNAINLLHTKQFFPAVAEITENSPNKYRVKIRFNSFNFAPTATIKGIIIENWDSHKVTQISENCTGKVLNYNSAKPEDHFCEFVGEFEGGVNSDVMIYNNKGNIIGDAPLSHINLHGY